MKQSSDDEGEGGSLLLHLLEGAMHKTEEEQEKVRLEKVLKDMDVQSWLNVTADCKGGKNESLIRTFRRWVRTCKC